ncbi:MAG: 1,4-alpha-glucan branching protein domain-containing protein [Fimbriimonadaceae bacterium]|nr:1,4-alpha-glucan branching protein domain-containing protein [Fimbriimonadaceae bacterium]
MPIGRFLLCLHSHMPYVLSHGKSPHGTDWLHESAAECYLPLLDVLRRLEADGIAPRWTVNLTPILAEQLRDPSFGDGFIGYCEDKIAGARQDAEKWQRDGEPWLRGLSLMWERLYQRAIDQFRDDWNGDIVGAFGGFQTRGAIEIITSGATHGYQPLLGTDESADAQVALGVDAYEGYFGHKPRGIWLPECAYRPHYAWKSPVDPDEIPWPRRATDEILAAHGIEYFFVDSHMIRGGQPLGTYGNNFPQLAELFARSSKYFTPPEEFRSEYEHYRLPTGLTVFARDPQTTVKVWSGDVGYPGDPYYLEFHKQQYPGRLKYWRISENKADLGQKGPYDPYEAYERITRHAQDLVQVLKGTLAHYRGQAERVGTLVAMYDTELFGHWWWEGPEFLYELAKQLHRDGEIEMVSGGDVLDRDPARHLIHLPEGSWGEGGYHHIWLNEDNAWTWKRLYPMERTLRRQVRDLVPGPAERVVRQAARELLLAEASDWQFLISTQAARDYSEIRFADHADRFERLAKLADAVHAGADLSPDEAEFLAECEQKDAAFPKLSLDYWRPSEA